MGGKRTMRGWREQMTPADEGELAVASDELAMRGWSAFKIYVHLKKVYPQQRYDKKLLNIAYVSAKSFKTSRIERLF